MRLFRRPPPPPPQLLRLSLLEEGCAAMGGTADSGARLSLPSGVDQCNLEDLMAATQPPRPRRGFPWPGRKSGAQSKYAVTPVAATEERLRSAVSHPLLAAAPRKPLACDQSAPPYLSNESLDNHDYLNNNSSGGLLGDMYRSVSTSALFEDGVLCGSADVADPSRTSSCEDLIDRCRVVPPGGGRVAPQQPLGPLLEEEGGHADTESLAGSLQHRSDESGYESDGTKNGGDEPPTSIQDAAKALQSPGRERFHSLDSGVHRFAALFQRLTGVKDDASRRNAMPTHRDASPSKPSKIGQFKAWTLDRKLLRSRWKKTEEKISLPSPSRRASIFQSSLFPSGVEDSPITPRHLETKSLPSLSSVVHSDSGGVKSSLKSEIDAFASKYLPKDDSEHYSLKDERDSVFNDETDSNLSNCGGLNYQLRLKKAGYKSASNSTNARRRLWLQSQLSSETCEVRREDESLPVCPRRLPSQLDMHELVSVDLRKDEHGELGVYITGCTDSEKGVLGYVIMDLERGGPAERSGRLRRGDELLMVNGEQLQGVSLEEARTALRVPEADMHLLLARELSDDLRAKEASLPSVPELREAVRSVPRLRHWTSDVSPRLSSHSPHLPRIDNERMGSNGVCTLPRRPRGGPQLSLHTVVFEKGPGRRSLGFSIVGGKDSPKGELGFYVKTIFANGQAALTGCLREGDEIYTLNGQSLQGLSHSEAISAFKKIKQGPVVLHIGRRSTKKCMPLSESSSKLESSNSKSCSTLDNI